VRTAVAIAAVAAAVNEADESIANSAAACAISAAALAIIAATAPATPAAAAAAIFAAALAIAAACANTKANDTGTFVLELLCVFFFPHMEHS
jgi:hypothetical protein